MKRLNVVLAFILLGILGWLIRVSSWSGLSPVRGRYTPGVDFAAFYTITHGRIQPLIPSTTYTGNLANGMIYLGEYARALLNAPLLLVTGLGSLDQGLLFYAVTPWPAILVLPLTIILGVHATMLASRAPAQATANGKVYLLAYGLAVLGFPSLILLTTSSATMDYFGWIFAGLLFYVLVRQRTILSARSKFAAMGILFLFNLQGYHHTTSLFVALMLGGVVVVQYYVRPRVRVLSPSLVVLYGVVLVSYILYLTLAFNGYFLAVTDSLGNLLDGILGIGRYDPLASINASNQFSPTRIVLRIVDVTLIIVVLSTVSVRIARRRVADPTGLTVAGFTVGMAAAAIFAVGWGGFGESFLRISAIAAVVSILGLGWLLVNSAERQRKALTVLAVSVIIVSPLVFLSGTPALRLNEHQSEWSAIGWLGTRAPKNLTVFSDSRLASPLIYYGIRTPIGFEDEGVSLANSSVLLGIYYDFFRSEGPDNSTQAICSINRLYSSNVDFVLYSRYFADPRTGVVGYLDTYAPANDDALAHLENSATFQLVYDSGSTSAFALSTTANIC